MQVEEYPASRRAAGFLKLHPFVMLVLVFQDVKVYLSLPKYLA